MKNIFINYKKQFFIGLPLFFVGLFIYLLIFQIEILVGFGFRIFTSGNIKIEKISFKEYSNYKKGKIELSNSILYDKNSEKIAKIPKTIITYENFKISSIDVYNPNIKFERIGTNFNIVDIFVNNSKSQKKEEDISPTPKKELEPILKKINVYNADLNYVDNTYSHEISQYVKGVNGYVKFYNDYNTELKFEGKNEKEEYGFSFSNLEKKYDLYITANNIKMNDYLFQYGYDSEGEINNIDGTASINLRINEDGFFGKGKLLKGKARYNDLNADIKDVDLNLDFLGEKIIILGSYKVDENDGNFNLKYESGKGVDIKFGFKNITYEMARKYKYLDELGLDLSNLLFDYTDINLNYKDKLKVNIDFLSAQGTEKNNFIFKDIKGNFIYENKEMKLENLYSKVFFKEKRLEKEIITNLKYKDREGQVKFNIIGNKDELLSNIKLGFYFQLLDYGFRFKLDSNIIDLSAQYNYDDKNIYFNQKENFSAKYNFENSELTDVSGKLKANFGNNNIDIKIKDNTKTNIDFIASITEEDKKSGKIYGNLDLKNLDYVVEADLKNLNIKEYSKEITGNIKGKVIGRRANIYGDLMLEDLSLKDNLRDTTVEGVSGKVGLFNNEKFGFDFIGEISNIKLSEYIFSGFKTNFRYRDSKFEIIDFKNRYINLAGYYNNITSKADFKFNIKNLNNKILKVKDYVYEIPEINGEIYGKIRNLFAEINVKKGKIEAYKDIFLDFNGKINYNSGLVYSENIKIDDNLLKFKYLLKEKKGEYNFKIFERRLSDFIKNGKIRVIGETTGKISEDNVNGEFKGSLNEFYYNGKKMPIIKLKGNYNNSLIKFSEIDALDEDENSFISMFGNVDLDKKRVDFKLKEHFIEINNLLKTNKYEIKGNLNVEGYARGPFDNIIYELKGNGGKVEYKDSKIENILFTLTGNKEKLKLNNFKILSNDSQLVGNGDYNLNTKKYNLDLESNEIKLDILNIFLEKYGLENIEGNGKINFKIIDNEPTGKIKVNNFKLEDLKHGIYLKNLSGDIELNNDNLLINKFSGKLNDGDINIKGKIENINSINNILENSFDNIKYNLVLDGKNINYSHKNYADFNFNTRIEIMEKYLFGNVTINSGKIKNILKDDFGLIKILKNYIRKKRMDENILLDEKATRSISSFANSTNINISFNIENGVDLDAYKTTNYITFLKGKVFGNGILKGNLEKLNFFGETSIKDGEFLLSGNKFTIDKALILFNNRDEYIPDINPNIVFSTSSIINTKPFEVSLVGPSKNLTFSVRSGDKISVNSLDSVLSGEEQEKTTKSTAIFLTNTVGGQVSNMILNPIVDVLRNSLGLSGLRVSSSLVAKESESKLDEEMLFGAYLEAEMPLYKDKIYWKIKANFLEDEEKNVNDRKYGLVNYDTNVYNRINKNLSFGIGAQKLKDEIKEGYNDMNYYIEMKFEKKFSF